MTNTAKITGNGMASGLVGKILDQRKAEENARALQAANPGSLILAPSLYGKKTGADNLAKVHRAEWQDYLARFVPIENELYARFNDDAGRAASVDKAGLTMAQAFDRSRQQEISGLRGMNVNLSPRTQMMRDRAFETEKALATVGAKNAMRTGLEDQRMAILAGGLSSVAQKRGGN